LAKKEKACHPSLPNWQANGPLAGAPGHFCPPAAENLSYRHFGTDLADLAALMLHQLLLNIKIINYG
jgi:hypothetical protein